MGQVDISPNASRRRSPLLIAGALIAGVLVLTPAAPSLADQVDPVLASIEFELDGFEDILLVEPTDRLFLTGGPNDGTLLVTDLAGNEISRSTGLEGVRQMVYDPFHDWVWVAVADGGAVRAHDATTGAFVRREQPAAGMCPSAIALVGASDPDVPNDSLVVASECNDRLAILDLNDFTWDSYTGFPGVIQLAPSPPPEQSRVVLLDETGVHVVDVSAAPEFKHSYAVAATSLAATSLSGARRVALGTATDVRILSFPYLVLSDTFPRSTRTIALEWTNQPAVVAVDADEVTGLKPAIAGPFWSFPVAPAVPHPNGIEAHSDGRIFIVAQLPPDPVTGGGGGTGVIVPVEGENPGSLSGTVGGAPAAAPGRDPATFEVRLLDAARKVVAVDTTTFASGAYSFTTVQPGTYYMEFRALTSGETEGFFGERYRDKPLLSKTDSTAVELSSGEAKLIDADLRPLFYDMFGTVFYGDILWMGNTSITKGCNPPDNTLYCAADYVTRGQMAAFLVRALGLTDPGTTDFVDDDGSIFEVDIEKLAAAGITKGCDPPENTRFCPDDPVTRGQMAAFLNRAASDLWPSE